MGPLLGHCPKFSRFSILTPPLNKFFDPSTPSLRNIESPAKSKMAARGHKMADGIWKGVQPLVIAHFEPLSLNKFFDPSTPSMRKGRDGENGKKMEKKWKKWKIMMKIAVH